MRNALERATRQSQSVSGWARRLNRVAKAMSGNRKYTGLSGTGRKIVGVEPVQKGWTAVIPWVIRIKAIHGALAIGRP
jgi:hypothetical protein